MRKVPVAMTLLAVPLALLLGTTASARQSCLSTFANTYPDSATSDNAGCQVCHQSAGEPYNGYGWDLRLELEAIMGGDPTGACSNQNTANIVTALLAIEGLDSDGDAGGFSNLEEINASTQPGWTIGNNNLIFFRDGSTQTVSAPGGIGPLDPTVGDCSNGVDDDGDGLADFPNDPGCDSASDLSERSAALPCDNGSDDDGDLGIDFDPVTFASPGDENTDPAGQGDPGCKNPFWITESPQCQDGVHNDGDGKMDYDAGLSANGVADPAGPDPQCVGLPWKNREKPKRCGLGYELVFLLPPLMWLHRRRRRVNA